ncbi:hypothetical protein P7L64_13400 [Tistrella bauzanensis]|uniref:hypothetical protein n=1 Tax=Tistrella bauzanensis TaxID=657419 RepID=UPI00166C3505|nr:hypothetical protein [Tistrella bauzanensis]
MNGMIFCRALEPEQRLGNVSFSGANSVSQLSSATFESCGGRSISPASAYPQTVVFESADGFDSGDFVVMNSRSSPSQDGRFLSGERM